jgi:hypothetical protein
MMEVAERLLHLLDYQMHPKRVNLDRTHRNLMSNPIKLLDPSKTFLLVFGNGIGKSYGWKDPSQVLDITEKADRIAMRSRIRARYVTAK